MTANRFVFHIWIHNNDNLFTIRIAFINQIGHAYIGQKYIG
jgi:hypothetical protein